MAEYIIKERQSAVDVSNQLYGDQDHLYDLLLVNEEFDINLDQYGLELEYEPVSNKVTDAVAVNEYTFINGEPTSIYSQLGDITLNVGYNDLSFLSAYYGSCFIMDNATKETFFLDSESSVLSVYTNNSSYSVWIEIYE